MKKRSYDEAYSKLGLFEKYLVLNPKKRALIDFIILVVIGLTGLYYRVFMLNWKVCVPIGIIGALVGHAIHTISEIKHKQAHDDTEDIKFVMKKGLYEVVRHPIYTGVFITMICLGLIFSNILGIIGGIFTAFLWVRTAWVEEKLLLAMFPEDYGEYKKRVKYMFLPYIL